MTSNIFYLIVGLSLKSQELTALFLAVRLYCSFVMEYDIHTLLDLATLGATLWVIYMMRYKLRSSYMEEKDNFAIHHVVRFSLISSCYCTMISLSTPSLPPSPLSKLSLYKICSTILI